LTPNVTQLARDFGRAARTLDRKALRLEEAAESLGVCLDFFREHIAPELRIVRKGRIRLIPMTELDRWLDENACHVL
jgi:excisionase family DNA binding protein